MKNPHRVPQTTAVIDLNRRMGLSRVSALGISMLASRMWLPASIGTTAALLSSNALADACVLSPDGRTGPFYTALDMVRSDVTEGKPGVVLDLTLEVVNSACNPVAGAAVAIWNCNSVGIYSEYPNVNPDVPGYLQVPLGQVPPEAPHYPEQNRNEHFLRGVQITDSRGIVRFRDIYPSWYATRTPHVHVKVYPGAAVGDIASYTGQLYFPEAVNTAVLRHPVYGGRTAPRDTVNASDRHYVAMGGVRNELRIKDTTTGLAGEKTLVIQG